MNNALCFVGDKKDFCKILMFTSKVVRGFAKECLCKNVAFVKLWENIFCFVMSSPEYAELGLSLTTIKFITEIQIEF